MLHHYSRLYMYTGVSCSPQNLRDGLCTRILKLYHELIQGRHLGSTHNNICQINSIHHLKYQCIEEIKKINEMKYDHDHII